MTFTKNQAAQMLLVGFCKSWLMSTVISSLNPNHDLTTDEMRKIAPFLPLFDWQYRTPTRAYVAAQWPNLNNWLIRNESDKGKLLTIVSQIENLVSKDKHAQRLTEDDKKEQRSNMVKIRRVAVGSQLAREQRKSHGRSAWNVCKP